MGIIGLDYHAVYVEAARIGVDLSVCTMRKIKCLEWTALKMMNED